MLRPYRRYYIFLAACLLGLPLVVSLVTPGRGTISTREAKVLAPVPSFPDSLNGWVALPRHIDAYLSDHFGLRPVFLRAYAVIMSCALAHAGNPRVLTGADGWMFYRGDDMVRQSAGMIRRDARVAETADLLATMHTVLAARGIRLLVASPPNSATIVEEELPLWARNLGRPTEYDVFLDDLAASGVAAVDLRPALRAAKAEGRLYRKHDTHWTPRGALVAFNAIAQADLHADWKLDPASVLGPPATIVGGDLARMVGTDADVTEQDQPMVLPLGKHATFDPHDPFATFVQTSDRTGPTIMIIGDSFTENYFAPFLLQHTGRVVWLHHRFCRFDWKWIDEFHPDEIWWMPNERWLLCEQGGRPVGLPPQGAAGR